MNSPATGRDKLMAVRKPSTLSPFRYPGGKTRLRTTIIDWISELGFRPTHFIEPFAGGASVGLAIAELDLADHVTLAEIDPDVSAVWDVVLNGQASELARQIRTFDLNNATAAEISAAVPTNQLARAFGCLLLNRISRSGIMAPGAGWLNEGENGRGIHSRWYPKTLSARIESANALREKVSFVQCDGLGLLGEFAHDRRVVAFVDPPYVVNGRGAGLRLYTHHDVDCERLFKVIEHFVGAMVITYHRSVVVERLADQAGIERRTITVQTGHKKKKRELIMFKTPSKRKRKKGVRAKY